jgi:hypothetical protein
MQFKLVADADTYIAGSSDWMDTLIQCVSCKHSFILGDAEVHGLGGQQLPECPQCHKPITSVFPPR